MTANGGDGSSWARVPRHLVVLLGALSAFAPLSIDMYLPALPRLQRGFSAPPSLAQATLTACLVGLAGAQLFVGPLSDRLGRRRPLLVGVGLYALASLACALAPNLPLLILLRLVQGAAGAAGIVIARAVVRDLRSGDEAARLFSLLLVVNGFAPALAPVIGAQLLHLGSWRVTFVALALLGGLLFVASLALFPETLGQRAPAPPPRRQRTIYRELLGDRRFDAYALLSGLVTGAMFAYIAGAPFVLENQFGVSPVGFSGVFAMNATGIVAASQLGARLVGCFGSRALLLAGVALGALGAALLAVAEIGGLGVGGVIPGLFLVVSAVGLVSPNATALAMADYPSVAGSASGLLGVGQFAIGSAFAPLVGAFGNRTAVPMVAVIGAFSLAAVLLAGMLIVRDRAEHRPAAAPGGTVTR
ncbi:MAG TPA: multidrug effflux MFS transporter [Acidimicrobiales bacterium]|nr:multidrug effflux MFS transporter [Acidimicrobiales bacterium]